MSPDRNGCNPVHSCSEFHHCHVPTVTPELVSQAQQALSRRSFVRTFGLLTAASWMGGRELVSTVLAEVSAQSTQLAGVFRLNLDNFAATLANNVGSVRLRVTGMPTSFAEIIVSRLENNQFFAVTSRCTHQQQTVSAMNVTTRRLVCPAHGSQFNPDGSLVNGPANSPLTRYNTTFDGNKIVSIEIPGLGFLVGADSVTVANQKRVRLAFPTVSTIRYQIQFRSSLNDGSWAEVPFSTTPEGALSQTVFIGNNTTVSLYVEPAAGNGFYAVTRANS